MASPKSTFQYTLQTVLLSFVVAAASLGLFGVEGIFVAIGLLAFAAFIRLRWYIYPTIKEWIVVALIILVLLALLLPALQSARESSRRGASMSYMKWISLAVLHYESIKGKYPSPFVSDAEEKLLFSWRVSILPYLERMDLYEKYDQTKAWNEGGNQALAGEKISLLCSPHDPSARENNSCSYVAVVGPDTMWPADRKISSQDFIDGPENTIMLVELDKNDLTWSEPRDISFDEFKKLIKSDPERRLFSYIHRPGFFWKLQYCALVAFADGHIALLSEPTLRRYGEAMCTPSGGEKVDLHDLDLALEELDWPRVCGAIVLLVAELLLIFRPIKKEQKACDIQ